LILGDAAHAIVPFHGQGMNAGFEDCTELLRLLDQFDDDWSMVLPEFDRQRKPNTEAIADMALENYITMRDSVRDPEFQLAKQVEFELERRFPDRFIPRYSMVMFHCIPYAAALNRGAIQAEIVRQLIGAKTNIADIDFDGAREIVTQRLPTIDCFNSPPVR
jgi:kynurenine 3-monooxygenase